MKNIHNQPINSNSKEEKISLSYTVGVPTALLEDPNLSDRQFRLMIHLIGLARKEGYCWASDKYLAQKMNVSVPQIQKELQSLEKNEWIKRHTVKEGMKSVRSIYVTPAFSRKVYEYSQRSIPDTPSGVSRILPAEVPIYKANNILSKKECPNSKSSDVPAVFSKELEGACEKLWEHVLSLPVKSYDPRKSKTTWFNWLDSMRKINEIDNRSIDEIHEMINYIHNDDFWDINVRSPQKLRQKWVEIELQKKKKLSHPKKEDIQEKNKLYAHKVAAVLKKHLNPKEAKLYANSSYLELGSSDHPSTKILNFSDKDFKDRLDNEIRKRNWTKHLT